MDKETINLINFALILAIFISNLLFLLCDIDFKAVIIGETILIPVMYLLFYIIDKYVDKQ